MSTTPIPDATLRPWGTSRIIDSGEGFVVKRLTLKPGTRLLHHLHNKRNEHWIVISGAATAIHGTARLVLSPDQTIFIPAGLPHRLQNLSTGEVTIIEIQRGIIDEEDITIVAED